MPHGQIPAQLLIGADLAYLFPQEVQDAAGSPIQTRQCRLKKSRISGRYILFGTAQRNDQLVSFPCPSVNVVKSNKSRADQIEEYCIVTMEDITDIDSE